MSVVAELAKACRIDDGITRAAYALRKLGATRFSKAALESRAVGLTSANRPIGKRKRRIAVQVEYRISVARLAGGCECEGPGEGKYPLAAGEVILAAAVLSIVLTAPLGAVAIMVTGNRVLQTPTPELDDASQTPLESEPPSEDGI